VINRLTAAQACDFLTMQNNTPKETNMLPFPDFIALSDAALVDEAAKLNALADAIKVKLDEAKALLRLRGAGDIYGNAYKATIGKEIVSWSLNKDRITETMGKACVIKHSKQIVSAGRVSFKPHVTLGEIKVA
jgi:hypothetical protein